MHLPSKNREYKTARSLVYKTDKNMSNRNGTNTNNNESDEEASISSIHLARKAPVTTVDVGKIPSDIELRLHNMEVSALDLVEDFSVSSNQLLVGDHWNGDGDHSILGNNLMNDSSANFSWTRGTKNDCSKNRIFDQSMELLSLFEASKGNGMQINESDAAESAKSKGNLLSHGSRSRMNTSSMPIVGAMDTSCLLEFEDKNNRSACSPPSPPKRQVTGHGIPPIDNLGEHPASKVPLSQPRRRETILISDQYMSSATLDMNFETSFDEDIVSPPTLPKRQVTRSSFGPKVVLNTGPISDMDSAYESDSLPLPQPMDTGTHTSFAQNTDQCNDCGIPTPPQQQVTEATFATNSRTSKSYPAYSSDDDDDVAWLPSSQLQRETTGATFAQTTTTTIRSNSAWNTDSDDEDELSPSSFPYRQGTDAAESIKPKGNLRKNLLDDDEEDPLLMPHRRLTVSFAEDIIKSMNSLGSLQVDKVSADEEANTRVPVCTSAVTNTRTRDAGTRPTFANDSSANTSCITLIGNTSDSLRSFLHQATDMAVYSSANSSAKGTGALHTNSEGTEDAQSTAKLSMRSPTVNSSIRADSDVLNGASTSMLHRYQATSTAKVFDTKRTRPRLPSRQVTNWAHASYSSQSSSADDAMDVRHVLSPPASHHPQQKNSTLHNI